MCRAAETWENRKNPIQPLHPEPSPCKSPTAHARHSLRRARPKQSTTASLLAAARALLQTMAMPMADNLVASIAKSFAFLDAHGAGFNSHPHHAHQPHHKAC